MTSTEKPSRAGPYWIWAPLAARIALGLVFLISGTHKAAAPPAEFGAVIEAYRILPEDYILPFAAVLPWLEAFLGMALLAGFLTRAASAAAGAFLLMFIGAISSTLARGIALDNCGCFGSWIHLTPHQALAFDSSMFLLCALLFWRGPSPLALDNWIERGTI